MVYLKKKKNQQDHIANNPKMDEQKKMDSCL